MLRVRCILILCSLMVLGNSAVPSKYLLDDFNGIDQLSLDHLKDYNEDYNEEAELAQVNAVARASERIYSQVESEGYPIEQHNAITEDGYILTMHRIPYSKSNTHIQNKQVIFLQHCLLCSSFIWFVPGPGKALPYILADLGYDVWMGNARGNTFSKNHITLDPKKSKFWNFSWHEIGVYDLPAMIDYVLGNTKARSLQYIGYSQGTTVFYVLASQRPEYNKKIKAMHSLAPIAFMKNMNSKLLRFFMDVLANSVVSTLFGNAEFLPSNKMIAQFGSIVCKDNSITQSLCTNAMFLIAGVDDENLNATLIPEILQITPAGASVNQIFHYAQSCSSGHFRQYDYGFIKNKLKYGSFSPPDYPLKQITTPVYLYYGKNDILADVKDVHTLASKLGNVVYNKAVSHEKWNHMDFILGKNIMPFLYDDVVANIKKCS